MHYKIFLLSTVLTVSLLLPIQGNAETIDQAVTFAVQNHPNVKATSAGAAAARQTMAEEKSAYLPRVSTTASFGRIYSDNTTTRGLTVERGAGYSWLGEGSASLTQTLYDWQATDFSVESASANFESLRATQAGTQQAIAIETASAYIQLLRTTQLLVEARSYLNIANDYYNRIETAFENGGADESEVSRAQDFISLAENFVMQFENGVIIAEATFKQQVGRLPISALQIPPFPPAGMPVTVDGAVAQALSLNGQLVAAQFSKKASQRNFKREKTNTLPVLEAELSVLKRDQADVIGGESEDARALLRMNWDYSLGGAQKAAQKRAALQAQEAQFTVEAIQRSIERDIQVAWAGMTLASKQKVNQQERLEAAEQTLATFLEQYEGGQQSLLDLLSAEATVFTARQDYLNAVYEEMSAAYTVMGLAGVPFYDGAMGHEYAG